LDWPNYAPEMKQLNFLLIFSFGLAMVMFTLENTAPTTVHFLPGLNGTLPLAALLLLVGGIGATAAWVFAVWTGVVRKVEAVQSQGEFVAQQVRIQELENDLQRYRATLDAQLGLLPAAGQSSAPTSPDADEAVTVSVG
jgi:Lipopolysaccharide assembly protein A domain